MFRRPFPFDTRIIGGVVVAIFLIAGYIGYTALNGAPFYPYTHVKVDFPTASNLVSHDDVRVDSQRVGQISSIRYTGNGAEVVAQLPPGFKVYKDAHASIGDVSSLGSEFLAISPGTPSAGPLGPQAIPTSHTQNPVEIDTVLSILQPNVRDALSATLETLGTGTAGQGQNLSDITRQSPTLLPHVGTTNATLADPNSNLTGFIGATDLLASRFQGRTDQLAALLSQMDTTIQAFDVNDTQALQSTLTTTAPALQAATPALTSLASAAGDMAVATADNRPGFAATGQGTPGFRSFLVQAPPVFDQVPPVSQQAVPAFADLATANQALQHPTAPFLAQLINISEPGLTYLAPYAPDMYQLSQGLSSDLSAGNGRGNWFDIASYFGGATATCRNPYPGPIGTPSSAYADNGAKACHQ